MSMSSPKPLILAILDGFGISFKKDGNPVMHAATPALDELDRSFPLTTLQASGIAVGLPWGEAGNSEVGHLTIGSGRVIYHHLPRIISAIRDGTFLKNETLLQAAAHVRSHNSQLHIAGLISSGSVHSYSDHLYALLEFVKRENLPRVYIHIFTDGRDAPPQEAKTLLGNLLKQTEEPNRIVYASVIGRTYAMDREEKWTNIQRCYDLLTAGTGEKIRSVSDYITRSYEQGIFDPVIEPAAVVDTDGNPIGRIQENDALIFLNFRADSMREITHAFVDDAFPHFKRKKIPNLFIATMTEYQKNLNAHAAFPALDVNLPLTAILGEAGLKNLHIAEAEKYAHVTYFFNGGNEDPFPGEKRILIPSPNADHNEHPEMQTPEITNAVLKNMDNHDVIIVNFANADMVGHAGDFKSAIKAIEVLDQSVMQLTNAILNTDGVLIITGDHGNIELKRSTLTGEKLTEHSLNPVPFFLVGKQFRRKSPRSDKEVIRDKSEISGILTDIAPTILDLLKIKKPPEMTGKSLLPILTNQESES
jgi:2,3-bisphosphoglycerate-independent phosphoglycerate mutase